MAGRRGESERRALLPRRQRATCGHEIECRALLPRRQRAACGGGRRCRREPHRTGALGGLCPGRLGQIVRRPASRLERPWVVQRHLATPQHLQPATAAAGRYCCSIHRQHRPRIRRRRMGCQAHRYAAHARGPVLDGGARRGAPPRPKGAVSPRQNRSATAGRAAGYRGGVQPRRAR